MLECAAWIRASDPMPILPIPPAGRTGPLLSRIRSLQARARLPAVLALLEDVDSLSESLYPSVRRLREHGQRQDAGLEDLALSVRQHWLEARPDVLRLVESAAASLEAAAHALEDRLRNEYPELWHAPPGMPLPAALEALFTEPEAKAAAAEGELLRATEGRAGKVLALRSRLDKLEGTRDAGRGG